MIEKKGSKALQHLLHVPVGSTELHDIFCYARSFCGNSTLPEQTGRIAARHLAQAQTFEKNVQSIMIKLRVIELHKLEKQENELKLTVLLPDSCFNRV